MNSILSDIWHGVILLPVTAGNIRQRQNGRIFHDGTISASVMVLCFLSVIFVFTESQTNDENSLIRIAVLLSLLSCMVILGIIACIGIAVVIKCKGFDFLTRDRTNTTPTLLRKIFLWFFGIGTIIYCSFKMIRQIVCQKDIIAVFRFSDSNAEIVYYVSVTIFVILEMVFMTVFLSYRFKHSALLHYAMLSMLSANFSVWFYTFSLEKTIISKKVNGTDTNTTALQNCMVNSSISHFINGSYPVLSPMYLEFSLVTITMILEIWVPVKMTKSEQTREIQEELGNIDDEDEERSPLISSRSTSTDSFQSSLEQAYRINVSSSLSFYLQILLSVIIFLPLLICNVIQVSSFKAFSDMHFVVYVYSIFYKVIMFFVILYGFFSLAHSCKPVRYNKSLRVREYMLLLAAFGMFQIYIFQMLAASQSSSAAAKTGLVENILSMPVDYLQTIFLIQASRFTKSDTATNSKTMEGTCLVLMLMNFGLWLIDSFLGTQYFPKISQQVFGHDQWSFVNTILFPVAVFFRFSTSFGYHRLYHFFSKA